MRCGCPECGIYMDHAENLGMGCHCPACGYTCRACLGTKSVISREEINAIREREKLAEEFAEKSGKNCQ